MNKKIYMQRWLQCHSRTKITSTDGWYLDIANKLFPIIDSSQLYAEKTWDEKQQASITLALYLEDCVATDGGWHRFSELYYNLYGSYLPFYEIPADYIPDEINEVDIALILWKLNSKDILLAIVENPFDEMILELAASVCSFLDKELERAPICDIPSGDWVMPSEQLLIERTVIPEIEPGVKLPESVRLFLEGSGGQQLMYFRLYEDMEAFCENSLYWRLQDMPNKFDAEEGNIVMFANPKGILIAPGVSQLFCDERNHLTYDPSLAIKEGYRLFTDKGFCPFDLLKYAVNKKLIPDAQFPFEKGKELLWNHWDFIARYFLGEFYEGR